MSYSSPNLWIIIVAIGVLRAMCISLPYQLGISEVTESTGGGGGGEPEKKNMREDFSWLGCC